MLPNDPEVLVAEVLKKLLLPLLWEIVTAGMSRCDNEGAWGFPRGGGWALKTRAVGSVRMRAVRSIRTLVVGSMMIVRFGEAEGCNM